MFLLNKVIEVNNISINISQDDYICISDIAMGKETNSRAADIIRNWLRNRGTLDFLSTWEQIYNPNFKVFESEHFKKQVGLLTFTPSIEEWCNKTNAIGIYSKRGRYGGTYAHKDIAFEFASAISPVFKLYLIKEFERLKELENNNKELDVKRILSKNNYLIHTEAIKNYLLPKKDYYNNTTAKEWRILNPKLAKNYNIRDYATLNELTVLSNIESHNAELIKEGKNKIERFEILSEIAKYQLNILNDAEKIKMIRNND